MVLAGGVDYGGRAKRQRESLPLERWKSLIEWERGVAVIPYSRQSVDERSAAGQIESDESRHRS